MCTDTNESLRIFLRQQLGDVEEDIETISSYISDNPPETSGELLKLRELQRKYREIAASIKSEIVKLGKRGESPENGVFGNNRIELAENPTLQEIHTRLARTSG